MGFMYLAISQAPIILGDISKNLEIMEKMIIEAQEKTNSDLDLIVFPELFITGYNLRDNYNEVAEKIPSSGIAQKGILRLSKKFNTHIITGISPVIHYLFSQLFEFDGDCYQTTAFSRGVIIFDHPM